MNAIFNKSKKISQFLFAILLTFSITDTLANSFITSEWLTKNGARVVFFNAPSVPMLDIKVAFNAGSAYDGDKFGLSSLTTRLLDKGNNNFDADTIAENFAKTGAQYNAQNTRDMVVLSLQSLTNEAALNSALNTFNLILNHPDFDQSAFNREKNQQLTEISEVKESPQEIASQMFFKTLYKTHPYAHPINGAKETVQNININDVKDFYHKFFTAKNAVIILVGAIDTKKARQIAENLTHELPQGNKATITAKIPPVNNGVEVKVNFPSSQTILYMGQLGIDYQDPQYFPLLVGNYLLGGGTLVSKLGLEVREKRGLTYGINSQFIPMLDKGPFIITLATKNNEVQNALNVTKDTLLSFLQNAPNEHDLNAARQYLTGSFPLALASNHSIAAMLLKLTFYNLPKDYLDTYVARINAVTAADIKNAMQNLIVPDKFIHIAVGEVQGLGVAPKK